MNQSKEAGFRVSILDTIVNELAVPSAEGQGHFSGSKTENLQQTLTVAEKIAALKQQIPGSKVKGAGFLAFSKEETPSKTVISQTLSMNTEQVQQQNMNAAQQLSQVQEQNQEQEQELDALDQLAEEASTQIALQRNKNTQQSFFSHSTKLGLFGFKREDLLTFDEFREVFSSILYLSKDLATYIAASTDLAASNDLAASTDLAAKILLDYPLMRERLALRLFGGDTDHKIHFIHRDAVMLITNNLQYFMHGIPRDAEELFQKKEFVFEDIVGDIRHEKGLVFHVQDARTGFTLSKTLCLNVPRDTKINSKVAQPKKTISAAMIAMAAYQGKKTTPMLQFLQEKIQGWKKLYSLLQEKFKDEFSNQLFYLIECYDEETVVNFCKLFVHLYENDLHGPLATLCFKHKTHSSFLAHHLEEIMTSVFSIGSVNAFHRVRNWDDLPWNEKLKISLLVSGVNYNVDYIPELLDFTKIYQILHQDCKEDEQKTLSLLNCLVKKICTPQRLRLQGITTPQETLQGLTTILEYAAINGMLIEQIDELCVNQADGAFENVDVGPLAAPHAMKFGAQQRRLKIVSPEMVFDYTTHDFSYFHINYQVTYEGLVKNPRINAAELYLGNVVKRRPLAFYRTLKPQTDEKKLRYICERWHNDVYPLFLLKTTGDNYYPFRDFAYEYQGSWQWFKKHCVDRTKKKSLPYNYIWWDISWGWPSDRGSTFVRASQIFPDHANFEEISLAVLSLADVFKAWMTDGDLAIQYEKDIITHLMSKDEKKDYVWSRLSQDYLKKLTELYSIYGIHCTNFLRLATATHPNYKKVFFALRDEKKFFYKQLCCNETKHYLPFTLFIAETLNEKTILKLRTILNQATTAQLISILSVVEKMNVYETELQALPLDQFKLALNSLSKTPMYYEVCDWLEKNFVPQGNKLLFRPEDNQQYKGNHSIADIILANEVPGVYGVTVDHFFANLRQMKEKNKLPEDFAKIVDVKKMGRFFDCRADYMEAAILSVQNYDMKTFSVNLLKSAGKNIGGKILNQPKKKETNFSKEQISALIAQKFLIVSIKAQTSDDNQISGFANVVYQLVRTVYAKEPSKALTLGDLKYRASEILGFNQQIFNLIKSAKLTYVFTDNQLENLIKNFTKLAEKTHDKNGKHLQLISNLLTQLTEKISHAEEFCDVAQCIELMLERIYQQADLFAAHASEMINVIDVLMEFKLINQNFIYDYQDLLIMAFHHFSLAENKVNFLGELKTILAYIESLQNDVLIQQLLNATTQEKNSILQIFSLLKPPKQALELVHLLKNLEVSIDIENLDAENISWIYHLLKLTLQNENQQTIPDGFQVLAGRCEEEQARCTKSTLSLRGEQQQRQNLKGEGYTNKEDAKKTFSLLTQRTPEELKALHRYCLLVKTNVSAMLGILESAEPANLKKFLREKCAQQYGADLQRFNYDINEVIEKIEQIKYKQNTFNQGKLSLAKRRGLLQDCKTIMKMMQSTVFINQDGEHLSIATLAEEDFQYLAKHCRQVIANQNTTLIDRHKAKLLFIALSLVAMYRTTGKFPRSVQTLAVINTHLHPDNINHEIATGEGKSITTALHTALHWVNFRTPDTTTANDDLAARDLITFTHFFNYLGIPVGKNIIRADSGPTEYVKDNVHYSTASNLSLFRSQMALLGHALPDNPALACDEVDAVLTTTVECRLAATVSEIYLSTEEWKKLYILVLDFINDKELFQDVQAEQETHAKHLREYLLCFSEEKEKGCSASFIQQLSNELLAQLIKAAITAHGLKSDIHFIASEKFVVETYRRTKVKKCYRTAAPIIDSDHKHNAAVSWSHAVQQFVHTLMNKDLTEGEAEFVLEPITETITTQSAKNFFDYYFQKGGQVVGLTGTGGAQLELEEFFKHNHSICYSHPRHEVCQLEDLGMQAVDNPIETITELMWECCNQAGGKENMQPVLITCESPQAVQEMAQFLKTNLLEKNLMIQQYSGDKKVDGQGIEQITKNAGINGTITIATEAMARGVDIEPTHPKGLFGVNTCIKITENDLRQIKGRPARNGHPGQFKSILDKAKLDLKEGQDPEERFFEIQAALTQQKQEERIKSMPLNEVRDYILTHYFLPLKAKTDKIMQEQHGIGAILISNEDFYREITSFNQVIEKFWHQEIKQEKYWDDNGHLNESLARQALYAKAVELWQQTLTTWLASKDLDVSIARGKMDLSIFPQLAQTTFTAGELCAVSDMMLAIRQMTGQCKLNKAFTMSGEISRGLPDLLAGGKHPVAFVIGFAQEHGYLSPEQLKEYQQKIQEITTAVGEFLGQVGDNAETMQRKINNAIKEVPLLPGILGEITFLEKYLKNFSQQSKTYVASLNQAIQEEKWSEISLPQINREQHEQEIEQSVKACETYYQKFLELIGGKEQETQSRNPLRFFAGKVKDQIQGGIKAVMLKPLKALITSVFSAFGKNVSNETIKLILDNTALVFSCIGTTYQVYKGLRARLDKQEAILVKDIIKPIAQLLQDKKNQQAILNLMRLNLEKEVNDKQCAIEEQNAAKLAMVLDALKQLEPHYDTPIIELGEKILPYLFSIMKVIGENEAVKKTFDEYPGAENLFNALQRLPSSSFNKWLTLSAENVLVLLEALSNVELQQFLATLPKDLDIQQVIDILKTRQMQPSIEVETKLDFQLTEPQAQALQTLIDYDNSSENKLILEKKKFSNLYQDHQLTTTQLETYATQLAQQSRNLPAEFISQKELRDEDVLPLDFEPIDISKQDKSQEKINTYSLKQMKEILLQNLADYQADTSKRKSLDRIELIRQLKNMIRAVATKQELFHVAIDAQKILVAHDLKTNQSLWRRLFSHQRCYYDSRLYAVLEKMAAEIFIHEPTPSILDSHYLLFIQQAFMEVSVQLQNSQMTKLSLKEVQNKSPDNAWALVAKTIDVLVDQKTSVSTMHSTIIKLREQLSVFVVATDDPELQNAFSILSQRVDTATQKFVGNLAYIPEKPVFRPDKEVLPAIATNHTRLIKEPTSFGWNIFNLFTLFRRSDKAHSMVSQPPAPAVEIGPLNIQGNLL